MICCPPVSTSAPRTFRHTSLPNVLSDNADKLLVLECPDRPINAGFHVTEVKLATIASLDCGRARQEWQEIIIQVMDVADSSDAPLTAGKLVSILSASLPATLSSDAVITVELSDGNEAIRLYDIGMAHTRLDSFVIQLSQRRASCKAAQRIPGAVQGQSVCCG